MKKILTLVTFFLCTQVLSHHFPTTPPNTPGFPLYPVTSIQAHTIYEGDEVFIGYSPTRYPCLEALSNFEGDTEYIEIDDNNNIEITVSGLGSFPCLNLDIFLNSYQFYSLGELSAGTYNIQMYWSDTSTPLPVPPGFPREPLGENIQFGVLTPEVIPVLNFYSLIILGVLILFITYLYTRKKSKFILLSIIVLLFFSGNFQQKSFI